MTTDAAIRIVLWAMAVLVVFIAWECLAEYRRIRRPRPTWELYAPYDEDENWSAEQDERRVH